MQVIDLNEPLKRYRSKWVILSKDYKKVLASAGTLKSILSRGKEKKICNGYVIKVAKDYSNYVGSV